MRDVYSLKRADGSVAVNVMLSVSEVTDRNARLTGSGYTLVPYEESAADNIEEALLEYVTAFEIAGTQVRPSFFGKTVPKLIEPPPTPSLDVEF